MTDHLVDIEPGITDPNFAWERGIKPHSGGTTQSNNKLSAFISENKYLIIIAIIIVIIIGFAYFKFSKKINKEATKQTSAQKNPPKTIVAKKTEIEEMTDNDNPQEEKEESKKLSKADLERFIKKYKQTEITKERIEEIPEVESSNDMEEEEDKNE